MIGIQNIGNSCYLNAALQLLFNSTDFCKMIELNKNKSANINLISQNINLYKLKSNIFNPSSIKKIIDSRTDLFTGMIQSDSSEVILFLFDIINKNNNNFLIEITTNIKCKLSRCLHETNNIAKELFLLLPITNTLDNSYREYKIQEKLKSSYTCDKCKNNIISRKKIITSYWPDNLLIVLKRFGNNMIKDNTLIDIPLLWRHGYKLMGGIIHIGNLNGGHYIYYGYDETLNSWMLANDSNISTINNIDKYTSQSYILYYKKFKE
jgi:ubiquitin carboxyl-terminal hydrolase 8